MDVYICVCVCYILLLKSPSVCMLSTILKGNPYMMYFIFTNHIARRIDYWSRCSSSDNTIKLTSTPNNKKCIYTGWGRPHIICLWSKLYDLRFILLLYNNYCNRNTNKRANYYSFLTTSPERCISIFGQWIRWQIYGIYNFIYVYKCIYVRICTGAST